MKGQICRPKLDKTPSQHPDTPSQIWARSLSSAISGNRKIYCTLVREEEEEEEEDRSPEK
jgi:hypothetical protein